MKPMHEIAKDFLARYIGFSDEFLRSLATKEPEIIIPVSVMGGYLDSHTARAVLSFREALAALEKLPKLRKAKSRAKK